MHEEAKPKPEKKLSTFEKVWGVLSVVFLFYLCIHFMDWGFLKGEITSYPIQCKQKLVSYHCSTYDLILNPTTFKPLADRQEVLWWVDNLGVMKLGNCAIKDRKNWSCTESDGTQGFNNGVYVNTYNGNNNFLADTVEKTFYVSKFDWIKAKCSVNSGLSGLTYYLCLVI